MRVRIRLLPLGATWAVEVKESWFLKWREAERFHGDKAEQLALEYAKRLKNPLIIEIGDQS
jgi:hypothetical protein